MKSQQMLSSLTNERNRFILIGLTGRTGSGCTTAAGILSKKDPEYPTLDDVRIGDKEYFEGLDKRRYEIVKSFSSKNHSKFFSIKVSDIISAYLLKLSNIELEHFIQEHAKSATKKSIKTLINSKTIISTKIKNTIFSKITNKILDHKNNTKLNIDELKSLYLYMELIRRFTEFFKKELNKLEGKLYLNTYQAAGNSIRRIGMVKAGFNKDEFSPESLFHLPESINKLVKLIRKIQGDSPCYVVIDAIRNPYEAKYFKDRYSAFYLMSINAPNIDRKSYLQQVHKYSVDQFDDLEKKESGKSKVTDADFVSQNVKRCIEISDIHIFNPRKETNNHNILKAQLAWYISLMQHPGLVSPTSLERVMQIAYSAKLNSGCISRQVGAVVTDANYSVKSVGWNDVAKGQVPCSLRSLSALENSFDPITYSAFERSNEAFRKEANIQYKRLIHVEKLGKNISYCFKSIKNSIDDEKNQVHTRSLHAEENAFLQLAKYGAAAIEGGKLFTTASPCELCAKKAYQLGIKDIVYIDPYPGIAIDHILTIGLNPPNLIQFRGAVGKGYHQLYEALMPYKDELEYLKIEI